MDRDSSDEEDVFCCGRCKLQFSTMDCFVNHKNEKTCRKITRRPQIPPCVPVSLPDIQTAQSSVPKVIPRPTAISLQEEQTTETLLSSGEARNEMSMEYLTSHVLDKLLRGTPHAELPSTRSDTALSPVSSSGGNTAMQASILANVESRSDSHRKIHQPQRETRSSQCGKTLIEKQTPESCVKLLPDTLVSPLQKKESDKSSSMLQAHTEESRNVEVEHKYRANQELTATNNAVMTTEAFQYARPIECKFCSETMKNADSLYSHYMQIHMMKGGNALQFLRQYAFKRKRGRPPKGMVAKKPTMCPHCSEVFSSKSVCKAHILKQHPNSLRDKITAAPRELLPGRLRKCSRCGFQTTTAKDLTTHIRSCHGNTTAVGATVAKPTKEQEAAKAVMQHDGTLKTKRGRKCTRPVPKENEEEEEDEDDGSRVAGGNDDMLAKEHVRCPDCDKKMSSRGLKRHQICCNNRSQFVCPLCFHKSRESYDHTVHVDNHKMWIKLQPNSLDAPAGLIQGTPQRVDAFAVDITRTSPLRQEGCNSNSGENHKDDYASTVDLEELSLITRSQGEGELPAQYRQDVSFKGIANVNQGTTQSRKIKSPALPLPDHQGAGSCNTSEARIPNGCNKKTNPRDLKCKVCYLWFGRTCLPKHMLQDHRMIKRFQCRVRVCREIFAKLEDFKNHIGTRHLGEEMFHCGCRSCIERRLVTPEKMNTIRKEKMRNYYKQMSHKCSKCWVKFPSLGSLEKHMKKESHHYPCGTCDKVQVSKRQLRMHMVTHQAERAFLCEVCGQNFKTKRDLNKHTFSHNNIRPYQCPDCGKCFSFKNKMTRHMTTVHSVKKPFACDLPGCEKVFSRKDKLHDHAKTHFVKQPFMCEHCARGFPRKDNLKDHEVLHTQRFRFRCTVCEKGFMRPKLLNHHFQIEHPATPPQVTLQTAVGQDGQPNPANSLISYMFYANVDTLASPFQENVQDAQLMQKQCATIEAIQSAAAAVLDGNEQNQFHIDGSDPFQAACLSITSSATS